MVSVVPLGKFPAHWKLKRGDVQMLKLAKMNQTSEESNFFSSFFSKISKEKLPQPHRHKTLNPKTRSLCLACKAKLNLIQGLDVRL